MTMTTATTTAKPTGGCGGDGCKARDPWPLYHVRHRGIYCRLCPSCVLKYHPGSFCALCYDILDSGSPATPPAPPPALVHCAKCTSVSHLSCFPNPDLASLFICPSCKNPEGFSFFPDDKNLSDGKRQVIEAEAAKVLYTAALLSANSMRKAATLAKAEAERKAKEAAMARKRAREMLERALAKFKKDKEKAEKNAAVTAACVATAPKPTVSAVTLKPMAAVEDRKRKWGKVGPGDGERQHQQQQRHAPPSREIEKWIRLNEPISDVMAQGKGEKGKSYVGAQWEAKSRVPSGSGPDGKEKKGSLLGSQSGGGGKEDERILAGSGEKGPRLPQATQDVLVSRTNPRSLFTGSPSTASLHS